MQHEGGDCGGGAPRVATTRARLQGRGVSRSIGR